MKHVIYHLYLWMTLELTLLLMYKSAVASICLAFCSLPPFTGNRIDVGLMRDGSFMLEAFALAMLIYVLSISSVQLVAEKTGDIIHTNQVGIYVCVGVWVSTRACWLLFPYLKVRISRAQQQYCCTLHLAGVSSLWIHEPPGFPVRCYPNFRQLLTDTPPVVLWRQHSGNGQYM